MGETVDTRDVPLVSRVLDNALSITFELFDDGRDEVLEEWIEQIRLFLIFVKLSLGT
jgi:hypothetical protein